uniref:G-protein coupled receptors family 1 profile domain-containing protein n=1 Tax=Hucho hucho TaxID=62062 RepID=A0A4W5KLM0_9TELE
MYFILLSLPLKDLIGITEMLPKVLSDIVTGTNRIFYPLCDILGFLLHMYGSAVVFILASMAFDHYVAIRYNTIITPRNRSEPNSKCFNTFVAQLVMFFIFEVVGTFTILSQRFKNVSADFWYLIMGMLVFLVSPLLNPIVYGLNASEIRITPLKVLV